MDKNKEVKKILIFIFSFMGLFLLSKFALITPANRILDSQISRKELSLNFGNIGFTHSSDTASLYWGATSNENFQDIFYRLSYLIENKVKITDVTINLHKDLFAQKKFDGVHLDRVIPYYPLPVLLERVVKTGFSYELTINFLKYKLGIPFRSSREISLILNNLRQRDFKYPYFSRKIRHYDHDDYISNMHYLWLIIEMLIKENVRVTIDTRQSDFDNFPQELKIEDLIAKIQKVHQGEVTIN